MCAQSFCALTILEVSTTCAILSTKHDQDNDRQESAAVADFEDGNPSDESLIHLPEHACDWVADWRMAKDLKGKIETLEKMLRNHNENKAGEVVGIPYDKNPHLWLYRHAGLQLKAGGIPAARLQMSQALQR